MAGFDMKDYVPVDERIRQFHKKHPEGSLQSVVIRWPEEGFPFIAVEARAFRTPDDPRPGVGLAYENFPGKTPYTRDSELMNAETSAWGRAIVAALAGETKRGPVASRDEVFRAQANQQTDSVGEQVRTDSTTEPEEAGGTGGDWKSPASDGQVEGEKPWPEPAGGALLPNEGVPSAATPWTRYLTALGVLAERDGTDQHEARKTYVMELCKVNRWAYPPRESTDADRLNEISASLEDRAKQGVLA